MRKVIYMAHQYGGDEQKRLCAIRWYGWVIRHYNVAPIADWILTSAVLDDSNLDHRRLGMELNKRLIQVSNEVWLCGATISKGMQQEVVLARLHKTPVYDFTWHGLEEPPDRMLGSKQVE